MLANIDGGEGSPVVRVVCEIAPTEAPLIENSSSEESSSRERHPSSSSNEKTPVKLGRASSVRRRISRTLNLFSPSHSSAEQNGEESGGKSRLRRAYSFSTVTRSLGKRPGLRRVLQNDDDKLKVSPSPQTNGLSEGSRSPFRARAVSDLSGSRRRRASDCTPLSLPLMPFGREETYKRLETVGEGSYATVYKGFSSRLNCPVALKEITINPEEGMPFTAIREASLLKKLKHANIVTLHDIIQSPVKLTFVFEYVDTDLSKYMEANSGGLPAYESKLFLFQLVRGLSYCHQRRILHRDLKPQNLLINKNGELKLADFGLARCKSVPSKTYSNEVVTLWYRPPDVLLGSTDYSTSIDMWGVGCIFAEMVSGAPLFPGVKDAEDQLLKIWQIRGTPTDATWPGVSSLPEYKVHNFPTFVSLELGVVVPQLRISEEAEDLAISLLRLQPKERMTAKEAMSHPYFAGLPAGVFSLHDEASIFTVPGVGEQKL